MPDTALDTVLVVDRGVPAVRLLRALEALQVKAVSVHVRADATALHSTLADESVLIGATRAAYGDVTRLVEAARQAGAQGVHPGTVELPGLEAAVLAAGLVWLGGVLQVPAELTVGDGVVEARCSEALVPLPPTAVRAAEVVTGLDLTLAALRGRAEGVAREGVAVSVDLLATSLAPVTALGLPTGPDVWVDSAVEVGTHPDDPLLAVLTAWGPDRDGAYARACEAWDQTVVEGPVVPRPAALGGDL
jgi:acetyl/propionyl-CoA carboxylase alpha subunit